MSGGDLMTHYAMNDDDPLTQKPQWDGIVDDDVRNVSSNKYLGRRGAVTEVISFWDDLRKHDGQQVHTREITLVHACTLFAT